MIPQSVLKQAKILIVDDEKANVRLLEIVLQDAGYDHVVSITDARQSFDFIRSVQPDILLLDLNMPYLDGFAVMRMLREEDSSRPFPILVLTADATVHSKHKALREGAKDYVTKPLDETEVLLRIHNLLETHFHGELLEAKVLERTHELNKAQLETLQRLALAAEYRDDDTGLHTRRVGLLAGHIAQALGLPAHQAELLEWAAPLHDVGKIGISDSILLKPGRLTDEEFDIMRGHAMIGAGILAGSSSPGLKMAEEIARSHHERWDGKGYPRGLSGEDIPLVGRIVAVADVFDALTHDRPYKSAWPIGRATDEIAGQAGAQFDENVVNAFLTLPHGHFV